VGEMIEFINGSGLGAIGTPDACAAQIERLWQQSNEALPQTDEVYAEDGALIAIANDRWTPIEPAGTMP
jgi:hypothetical protein